MCFILILFHIFCIDFLIKNINLFSQIFYSLNLSIYLSIHLHTSYCTKTRDLCRLVSAEPQSASSSGPAPDTLSDIILTATDYMRLFYLTTTWRSSRDWLLFLLILYKVAESIYPLRYKYFKVAKAERLCLTYSSALFSSDYGNLDADLHEDGCTRKPCPIVLHLSGYTFNEFQFPSFQSVFLYCSLASL